MKRNEFRTIIRVLKDVVGS